MVRSRVGDGYLERLVDARGRRVVFVSHCLLNENVRFLGGATRSGAVREVLDPYLNAGVGLVQMPCPEQLVWGGVLKRRMLALYGRPALRWPLARRALVAVVRYVTKLEYARLGRRTADQIVDYVQSGFEVVGVVGVGASPSCGVHTTVDLEGAVAAMARCDRSTLAAPTVVRDVVAANVVEGDGLFVAALRTRLTRRAVHVPFLEHDLLGELRAATSGEPVVQIARSPCTSSRARGGLPQTTKSC